jgi:hypothetical protein
MLFSRQFILKKHLSFFLSLIFAALVLTLPAAFAKQPSKAKVPDGTFEYREAGQEFSIRVPGQWIAQSGSGGFAVTLRPSENAPRIKLPGGLIADPSISVAVSKKPVVISEQSLETIAKEIEEGFVRYNGADSQFRIFQKNVINDLPDGRKALLYYVSFVTDGQDAGQAILVTGTDKARYRVTLTDHRINFDRNLENYYPYMVSIDFKGAQLSTDPAAASGKPNLLLWAIAFISAGIVVGLVARIRRGHGDSSSSDEIQSIEPSVNDQISALSGRPRSSGQSSQVPLSVASGMESSGVTLTQSRAASRGDGAEYSMIPQSRIGVADVSSEEPASSDFSEAVFTEKDLSAPPQSVPLSQVVDETSAPPEMKKRWQIFTNPKK